MNYLRFEVYNLWKKITESKSELTDFVTVEQLESHSSIWSKTDQCHINKMFAKNIIFSNITDFQICTALCKNVINTSIRILNIYIFIKNCKYLKLTAKIMRVLLFLKYKSIIRENMKQHYTLSEDNNFHIQISEVNYCQKEYY